MANEENASASISSEGELPQVLDEKNVSKPTGQLVKANDSIMSDSSQNITQDGLTNHDESHDQLRQMIIELSLQNEYLKNHIGDLNSKVARPKMVFDEENKDGLGIVSSDQENHLHEEIKKLKKEIQAQKETQKAAEAAMEHLRNAHSEADGKVQELSVKLSEVQQKMEQEIKERDEKYVELDSKFGRLHKRAKQRIQELQKEKDDLEARFHDVNTKFEQATSQQLSMQQDLERARQQASEALRSMDVERQQLRTTNSKLRDNVDEMRRALDAKESAIEGLQQSVLEKEQMLEQVQGLHKASEEKRQSLSSELSSQYQKKIDNLEAQLNDALAERTKAAETISSLQVLLAEKDSKIAELDASSTGETVRFAAAMEELRQKLNHLKNQHENEKQDWEANCQALRTKLEVSEGTCLRFEIELAKLRSQLELESSSKSQLLSAKDIELISAKDEISRLESEFSAYKVRAHALLQKKDAELSAAKNSEYLKAHDAALEEAKRELVAACAERDKALEDLYLALKDHDKEIAKRDEAFGDAEQRIRSITMKLDSTTARYMSEKEIWQRSLESVEENWKSKYTTLEAQKVDNLGEVTQKELEKMKLLYEKLKEEHDDFRNIADRAIEEKEKEIAKLIDDNKKLHHSLESMSHVEQSEKQKSASLKQDSQIMNIAAAEQQILLLASQQAQREEELSQFQRHILALQEEIEELEHENRLHDQQETMLKEELRNMERSHKREGIDMTYLKNVIVKLLETGEVEALLPVVATLLQFSPEETKKCQQVYRSSNDLSSPAAPVPESPSTAKSMFSRFGFS